MGWTTSQKSTSISTFNHWLGEAQCKDIRATNGLVPWPPLANERLDPKKTKELSLSMAEDSSSKKITSFLSRWLFSCFPCFGFCCSGFPLIGLEWRSFNTQAPPTFLEKKTGIFGAQISEVPDPHWRGKKKPTKAVVLEARNAVMGEKKNLPVAVGWWASRGNRWKRRYHNTSYLYIL